MSKNNLRAMSSTATAIKLLDMSGYEVALPLDHASPSDLLAKDRSYPNNKWLSIQVKTAYASGTSWVANLCRTTQTGRKAYFPGEVDYFVFVIVDTDLAMMVPASSVRGKTRIRLDSDGKDLWLR